MVSKSAMTESNSTPDFEFARAVIDGRSNSESQTDDVRTGPVL